MSCREKAGWSPSRWKPTRIRRFVKHVREHANRDVSSSLGVSEGALFLCWFKSMMGSAHSHSELHARGVKLLGDTETQGL